MRDPQFIEPLAHCLTDGRLDSVTAENYADALAAIDTPQAIKALEAASTGDNWDVCEAAQER